MEFRQGHIVIHPHHGPASVIGTTTRMVKGIARQYVELSIHCGKMTVSVPLERAEEIGIRDVAGLGELEHLAAVLSAPTGPEESQWARRFKANRALISTGNPIHLAEVVRDLTRRLERGGLSLGEKDLLKEASIPLVAEIALATGSDEENAVAVMRTLIIEESMAVLKVLEEKQTVAA
ncbi:transcriptional regulator, CarD family [Raineyella antarctica]|uniref:Transcriptional regulator, CarD family n=1 Tax=Raineyella antarctica TaxID=1577474 RepID=A0A1G6GRE1_9ACTN|nr:CarD family transcriptional regulator [Raineyella antarctica]SDB84511.1 transcriptional regulator, CarD family [Raineyella antarctica]